MQSCIFRGKSYQIADHHSNTLLLCKFPTSADAKGKTWLLFGVRISLELQTQTTSAKSLPRTFTQMPQALKFSAEQLWLN